MTEIIKPAELLVDPDKVEEGVGYIQPNIETKLDKDKRQECRNIVQEIKNYGVTQRQILYLIYLLSLELENVEVMRAVAKCVGENREKVPTTKLVVEGKKKIAL